MDLQLTGRGAVVTGGSRGIGLAVGRALAAEGAHVALVARGADDVASAARDVAAAAAGSEVRVVGIAADTGDDASVAAMARRAADELGSVDILVNCAARPNTGMPLRDEDLAREINVKVAGYLRCARAFAPGMAERGWGRIVNVSGLAARQTSSIVGSVRNVAVAAMTKNLADELGPSGINVTVVHPGMTRTERTPETLAALAAARGVSADEVEASIAAGISIGRFVTADEVAAVVAFLASPLSVAITGDAIAVGGGARGAIHY
jgi:NAD(P)-dependent dehydrogenase (short-subunit alcohol dehydrogenase family)